MLILLLGGLWAGIHAQSVRYVDATGAALWVLPADTRTLFTEGTQLPTDTLETIRATPGVEWAAPALGQYAILDLHDTKAAAVEVGSEPGQPGGAWALSQGRAPSRADEVAFATHRTVESLLRTPGKTNTILVGTEEPTVVRARLATRGLAVLDPATAYRGA